ncbi:MAG: putative photosynthetic complex assembly protein PuhE, partial [Pseudomonadota bacterium]
SAAMLGAMALTLWLRDRSGIGDAYLAFAAGVVLWAWHETMFLLGYISGPRKTPCPPNLKAWPRFLVSTQTVIHHEAAIAFHAAALIGLSWGTQNPFVMATFLLLWGMRLNAKFVVFLGAPNISDEVLPSHLTYLSSYFGKQRVTAFFPLFISTATIAATALTYQAAILPLGSFEHIGFLLLGTLAALAVLEHWLLILPVPDTALWSWAIDTSNKTSPLKSGASQYGRH